MLGPTWRRARRFWRPSVDRDVDDELAFHLAMRAELYRASGLDPQTARDAALHRFGDVREVRARCVTISHERERRMRRLEILSSARQHARYALRRLRAAPGFAAAVVAMLALGIGATTAVFGVVDGVLLRPLPFPHPERLVGLSHTIAVAGIDVVQQSDASFLHYQRHATATLAGIGVYRTRDVNLGASSGADAERASAAFVSASLFPVLGTRATHGRTFRDGEDRVGATPVVILSAALWRRRFGADPAVVGSQIVVDGRAREVVGVMPDDFRYPDASTGLWLPLSLDPATATLGSFNFTAVARLEPDASPEAARAELGRVLTHLLDEYPGQIPRAMWEEAKVRPVVTPLRDVIVGDVRQLLWILLAAVGLLLSIACANVASLFLVRAEGTQRDIAVRGALGAGAGAVVAQYVGEALLLCLGGGTLGVALAAAALRGLRALPSGVELPRLAEVGVDGRVLAFAVAASVLGALAVSLLPVLRARRVAPTTVLKESSRSATVGRDRQRARSTLVVAQVAIALVLVAGSALMARSVARLRAVQPGFDATGVLTTRVALPRATYDAPRAAQFYERLFAELRTLPGVRAVAATDWVPLTDDHNDSIITFEDRPLPEGAVPPDHPLSFVSGEYFRAMGIPLLAGRTFGPITAARPAREVIVSRAFAEQYWPGTSPLGKRLRPDIKGPWYSVVGVSGDAHLAALEKPAERSLYFPMNAPDGTDSMRTHVQLGAAIVVRSAGDPAALGPAVRAAVRRIDPALPTYDERPMTTVLAASAARTRFTLLMLGAASLVALAIGAVGLYGVMAYGVTLRRREIGVRIALGASASDVSRMIARRGVLLAAMGVVAGLAATLGAARFLRGLLFGVSPSDPAALGATCGVLLAVAAVASWLPARRAASVDPMEALRRD